MSDFKPGDSLFDRFTAFLEELRFDPLPEDAEVPESVREYEREQYWRPMQLGVWADQLPEQYTPECGESATAAGCLYREPSLRSGDLP